MNNFPFSLIETMKWLYEGGCPLLPLHLARLRRSCDFFKIPYNEAKIEQALQSALKDQKGWQALKVRLLVRFPFEISVESFPLKGESINFRCVLSPEPVVSTDFWLQYKTTNRALYDYCRQSCGKNYDEVLFLNEKGEVAEGTITSIFVKTNQGLKTPPLQSGVLPGVLRASLLEKGAAYEEVIWPHELEGEFLLGNAVRGLVQASLRHNDQYR